MKLLCLVPSTWQKLQKRWKLDELAQVFVGYSTPGFNAVSGRQRTPRPQSCSHFHVSFFFGAPCKRLSPQVEQSILMGRLLAALHQPICRDLWPECHRWRTLLRSTYVQYDTGATELRVHAPTLYTCHACLLGSTRC